ncbi:unnamed protein product [Rotaria sp. Silwood2]|nr:unnamed protein product [Rotaria sp. Silwood2]CAF2940331.1 unnamed protein product [Rotaria sp. Silwood2]CAF3080975.1 unnamed protein product [Rotaria sp. Silwood2]CAF4109672.1 unnamed protein product [Rotaria sp. Silwood2]CAF4144869.1 unnamed protein product [Rotaria sp. Silwood2]
MIQCAKLNLTFSPQRFTSDFDHSIWRKIQELGLSRLVSSSRREINDDDHKKADRWVLGAIDLALIPPSLVETTWVSLMNDYTPKNYQTASQFNDFMVSTYVENGSTRFGVDIWNVYEAIVNRRLRTNNHVEGYNRQMKAEFPIHPHIDQFIETLRMEHEYQHHIAEASQVQLRRRKKIYDQIDIKLVTWREEHMNKK